MASGSGKIVYNMDGLIATVVSQMQGVSDRTGIPVEEVLQRVEAKIMASSSGKNVSIPVTNTDTAIVVKRKYRERTGIPVGKIILTFREQVMEDHHPLYKHGIQSGDIHLVSLGHHEKRPDMQILAVTADKFDSRTIVVRADEGSRHPDLKFTTIRLSCETHVYNPNQKNYGGFILYGWNDDGTVLADWTLNGKHCKCAYLVVQNTDSDDVKRYIPECRKKGLGQVHGAVYWNVFGKGADPHKAIGEGFSYQNSQYRWHSGVFNMRKDGYHNDINNVADRVKACVKKIMNEHWIKERARGKTYSVKELMGW